LRNGLRTGGSKPVLGSRPNLVKRPTRRTFCHRHIDTGRSPTRYLCDIGRDSPRFISVKPLGCNPPTRLILEIEMRAPARRRRRYKRLLRSLQKATVAGSGVIGHFRSAQPRAKAARPTLRSLVRFGTMPKSTAEPWVIPPFLLQPVTARSARAPRICSASCGWRAPGGAGPPGFFKQLRIR
jgi:hypothetical protein